MKIMDTVVSFDTSYGRGLSSILDKISRADCKETKETENEIKAKIKSLKDERNTHNQRITAIDAEIAKLEAELSVLSEQNKATK